MRLDTVLVLMKIGRIVRDHPTQTPYISEITSDEM
jgi:hypothetical protein